jgi:hypothetical protein
VIDRDSSVGYAIVFEQISHNASAVRV